MDDIVSVQVVQCHEDLAHDDSRFNIQESTILELEVGVKVASGDKLLKDVSILYWRMKIAIWSGITCIVLSVM